MDGGGRLPRQIDAAFWQQGATALACRLFGLPALATQRAGALALPPARAPVKHLPAVIRNHESRALSGTVPARLSRIAAMPGAAFALGALVLAAAGISGSIRGGQYDAFIQSNGTPGDFAARTLGFGIAAVVITADNGMPNDAVLAASGVTTRSSLPFVNVADVRDRLKAVPIVKEASVRKLYPDRLVIDIEERAPFALWQKDGKVVIVAADGTPIENLSDDRFANLPFVVGAGANLRAAEFAALLEGAGELRGKIRAGVLVAGRRWELKMTNDVEVKLPEIDPQGALAALAVLERDNRVLEKDVVFLDFRVPGRMVARLGEEAAANRAAWVAAHAKSAKPGQT